MIDELRLKRTIGFLRGATGAYLIWLILPYLDHSFIDQLPVQLERYAIGNPYWFIRSLLHYIAIPNAEPLATVLSVGTLVAGAALLLGFMTRLAALAALAYAVIYFLTAGHLGLPYHQTAVLLGLVALTLLRCRAGHCYGLDGLLFKPKSETVSPKKIKAKSKKQKETIDKLAKALDKQSKTKKSVRAASEK